MCITDLNQINDMTRFGTTTIWWCVSVKGRMEICPGKVGTWPSSLYNTIQLILWRSEGVTCLLLHFPYQLFVLYVCLYMYINLNSYKFIWLLSNHRFKWWGFIFIWQGYPQAGGVHEQYTHPGSDPSQPMSPSCYYPPSSRMYLLYTVLYNNNI